MRKNERRMREVTIWRGLGGERKEKMRLTRGEKINTKV
jgi:hypothetical protein